MLPCNSYRLRRYRTTHGILSSYLACMVWNEQFDGETTNNTDTTGGFPHRYTGLRQTFNIRKNFFTINFFTQFRSIDLLLYLGHSNSCKLGTFGRYHHQKPRRGCTVTPLDLVSPQQTMSAILILQGVYPYRDVSSFQDPIMDQPAKIPASRSHIPTSTFLARNSISDYGP